MRIALTGASGGLGRAFLTRAAAGHDVIPFTHARLAVEDGDAVLAAITASRPAVVIHAAAMTSVDGCELDPAQAARVNAVGTGNVARAARRAGACLVAISTDYVFDGEKGEPYHESDTPNPLSVYGRTKLGGEREAQQIVADHLIVRTSWVFGGGSDFLTGALTRLAAGESVPAIADRIGSPTFVGHLAERLVPLVESGTRGVVHLAGPEPSAWHDVLSTAVETLGLPGDVTPQKAEELNRPAPRPRNSSLTSSVLPETPVPPMPPLDAALREVLEGIRGRD